jgi:hypothetical protein
MDAGGAMDESAGLRTAEPCGPDAPTLASSRWRQLRWRRWQESPVTGESAEETVNTIAQGRPDYSGEPVVTNSCAYFISHARLRVHWAPGFPCSPVGVAPRPLLGEGLLKNSDASRRGNAES